MKEIKYKAKRIHEGLYEYRGFKIESIGYFSPEQKVVWEAIDENGGGFAHSFSLRDTKLLIDDELDGNNEINK